jgi:hypothetical protein
MSERYKQGCSRLRKKDELTRREPLESVEIKLPLKRRKLGLAEPPATSGKMRTTRVRKRSQVSGMGSGF